MENKLKFTEKIVRANNKKIKRDADRFLRIFLIVFIFGYLFFFSSTLWMPTDYTGVKASVIGKWLFLPGTFVKIRKCLRSYLR